MAYSSKKRELIKISYNYCEKDMERMKPMKPENMDELDLANHITILAERMVALAKTKGKVEKEFNGIMLTADEKSNPQDIIDDYRRKVEESYDRYLNSPEGKRAALEIKKQKETKKRENKRRVLEGEKIIEKAQQEYDKLMQQLPNLDFTNFASVLDWLCKLQDPSDRVGVVKRQSEVLNIFAKHGYQPFSEADDFEASDAESRARHIINRALENLKSVGAIHPSIHKSTGDWKRQFKV